MKKKSSWLDKALGKGEFYIDKFPVNIVDIGSTGTPPVNCKNLASVATYLGFDPDLREIQDENCFGFAKYKILNKAVSLIQQDSVTFNLTKYPQCSSVLCPDINEVQHYSISDFFEILDQSHVPAITLNEALEQADLAYIDWLKLDTQGTDYDILQSLDPEVRKKLLVVDIEPGINPFYKHENRLSEIHDFMLSDGFWLADLSQQCFPRISVDTIKELKLTSKDVDMLGSNPFAVELQYFRTIESLKADYSSQRDFFVFWLLAMTNGHSAYALEIALAAKCKGLSEEVSQSLVSITLYECQNNRVIKQKNAISRGFDLLSPFFLVKLYKLLINSRTLSKLI